MFNIIIVIFNNLMLLSHLCLYLYGAEEELSPSSTTSPLTGHEKETVQAMLKERRGQYLEVCVHMCVGWACARVFIHTCFVFL